MFGSTSSSINLNMPPSEILGQMLFANYVQRLAKSLSKRIILFAPTQPEEELAGYDAALIGDGCRELYLQFKRGTQFEPKHEIRFKVDNTPSRNARTKQLDTLKKDYPPLSAYYVAGGFWNVGSTLEAQRVITSDDDFLDIYAAISAHAINLPTGNMSSQVCLGNSCEPCSSSTKSYDVCMVQSKSKKLAHGDEWLYGSELIHDFLTKGKASGVGCTISTHPGQAIRIPNVKATKFIDDNQLFLIQPAGAILAGERRIPRHQRTDSTPMLTVRVFDY